jgi:hypothetical protein
MTQSTFQKLSVYNVICLQAVNYRSLQRDALALKAELLYGNFNYEGSDTYGWMDQSPAEVVEIDCQALYMNPHMKERGILNKVDLLAAHRAYWEGELAKAKVDEGLPKHYKEVCENMLAAEPTHVLIGGIHRGHIFPVVVARWMDNDIKHTDVIPCEVGYPKTYEQLQTMQHLRNALGSSQVQLLDIDIIAQAVDAQGWFKTNGEFRHFIATGAYPSANHKGQKEQGKSIQWHWYISTMCRHFFGLKILERIFLDPETCSENDRKRFIDVKKVKYVPKFGGSLMSNVMRFGFCADPIFRAEYRGTAQGKSPAPIGSEEEAIENGTKPSWSIEQAAHWWNMRCPYSGLPGAGELQDSKPITVDLERVKRMNKESDSMFVREVAGALLVDPNIENGDKSGVFGQLLQPIAPALDAAYRLLRHPAFVAKTTAFLVNLDIVASTSDNIKVLELLDRLNDLLTKSDSPEVVSQVADIKSDEQRVESKAKSKKQQA